ncbi:plancitoxin-1-like isoform X2 [Haemaphysalis longicornis]
MISFKGVAVFWLAVTALVSGVNARVSCMDENNNEVPWFFIYKFRNGTEYAYVDKHTPDTKHWPVSSKSIASDEGALANTIGRLWGPNKPKDLIYAVYNDQWGNKTDDGGHTKGVFMFDAQTAVWLIHSVPNFPGNLDDERYEYPTSGERNGQVALCVTFKSGQEKTIAEHLLLQHPNIYAKPRTFKKEEYPHLDRLFNGKFTTARPWVLHDKLYDIEGTEFRSFAKHGNFDKGIAAHGQVNMIISCNSGGPFRDYKMCTPASSPLDWSPACECSRGSRIRRKKWTTSSRANTKWSTLKV